MVEKKQAYYLGIDLGERYAMISYYQLNKNEPETFSTIAGSERFLIPVILSKRKGIGQWYYGQEAQKMTKTSEMICVDRLLQRAVAGERVRIEDEQYEAKELLLLYMQKLIKLPETLGNPSVFDRLVVTVDRLTRQHMELLWWIAEELGLNKSNFMVIDHKESYYYFALNQKEELWLHDMYLFECENREIRYYTLQRNARTTPQTISISEGEKQKLSGDMDEAFLKVLQEAFANQIVSAVYLVGDGFAGDWMKESLNFLCRGRRVFMGKNLYSKGACYAAFVRDLKSDWNFVYMGEHEMKFNLSLKVRSKGTPTFYHLITAGVNWFETSGQCEVILNDATEVQFWKQLPNSREAKIETLELTDLPKRPNKTTRLRIKAVPLADDTIEITIKDLGFGEFFRSSDKSWKYRMSM